MTRTRRMLLGATAGIALLAAGYSVPARAEIPVIDTAALGEWIVSLANELKAYALQLQQYLTQVKQYVGEELSWATQASQYATQLSVHVNHLNRALRETSGKTTSRLISERLIQEAKTLLLHTHWNIGEVAWCLGFEERSHFINFFKKNAEVTPGAFRNGGAV